MTKVSSPSSSTRSASCLTVGFTLLPLAEIATLEALRQRLATRSAGRLRHRSTVAFVLRVNSFLNPLLCHLSLHKKGPPATSDVRKAPSSTGDSKLAHHADGVGTPG